MSRPPVAANAAPYSQPFLNESKNSFSFLEEVTYKVNLRCKFTKILNMDTELYTIKSTCYNHENMDFCPVLVQISNEIQKFHNGAKFLLQVWTRDNKKIYEKPLRQEVIVWAVCYKYLLFKTEASDEDSDCFHLVNLENNNSTVLIEDFVKDPEYKYLAYHDSIFYVASTKNIKLLTLVDDFESGSTNRISPDVGSEVATIVPEDMKIHGILINTDEETGDNYVLVPLETLDNQIDFNILEILQRPPGEDFDYSFKQFREVVPRNDRFDPITKFVAVFDKWNDLFAVALRESSKVDFYYNGQRVSSITDPAETIFGVDCSFDESYVLIGKQDIRAINHELTSRICIEESYQKKGFIFQNIFYQKIKNHCKLYNSFVLLKTYMLIAHGHIVSFFSVLKQKWIKHFAFESSVVNIFRQKNGMDDVDLCVLLADGSIKFINQRGNVDPDSDDFNIDQDVEFKLEGSLVAFDQDREDNNWTFILTSTPNEEKESGQNFCLNILHQRQVYPFTDERYPWLSDKTNFVFLFSPNEKTELVIQADDHISLFELFMGEEEPQVNHIWSMEHVPDVQAEIHSGIRFKNDRYMFLVDNTNFYKIDVKTNETKTYEDQNCIGLYFSDNNYMYTLCHKSKGTGQKIRPAGFKLYDIENVIEKDQDLCYLLNSVQVGCQGLIDFSLANQRLVYLSSFDSIEVIPVLHRNTISYIGMKKRNNYIGARQIQDKIVVLDKKNHLTTWGVMTGKIRMEWNLSANKTGQDYSNFEVYQYNENNKTYYREWFNKILLKSKTPIFDYDENQFFDPQMTKSNIKSQVSFIKKSEKAFYEFKLIEIINEREVKEHLTFVHPFYEDRKCQNLFFSQDTDYMFEHLSNERFFLYKKVQGPAGQNKVKWQQVHRFTSFPNDLARMCMYPYLFSKDFSMFLDVDRKNKRFMIRDSFTQEVRYHLPEWLMDMSDGDDFLNCAMRFTWIDNDTVKIVNPEGIERLVDLKNNFKEIEFNVIPLFKKEWCNNYHYYLDPPPCEEEIVPSNLTFNTLERLKRKYQLYKSAFYLEKKSDPHSLYQVLHTVDFNVNETSERFISDLSFTFLHWNLIEQLESGAIDASQIDSEQVERLIYNILPGGDTFLHILADKSDVLEEIFNICHPNAEDRSEIKYEVPFLINFDGKSPMDILKKMKDFKGMDMLLHYLSGYGIDHHSRAIQSALPVMVEHQLPSLCAYLDSRLLQTEHLKKFKKGMIRITKSTGTSIAPFWISPADMSKVLQPAPIEQEIRLEFVDIPNVHTYDSESAVEFFEAIAKTEDMEIFNRKAIKKIIEYKWPLTREYTVKKLFIPFVFFLSFYLVYMNYIFYNREESDKWMWINYGFMVPLTGLCYYFLSIEIKQLQHEGVEYLKSVWNYLDLIPPILLSVFIPLAIVGVFDDRGAPTLEACLQATMSLILWLKFLYFLRIFQSTGYLIRIITSVIVDMRHFLLILLLTIIAFGDAMRSISTSNNDSLNEDGNPNQFVGSEIDSVLYIYRMILGDFDTSNFGEVAVPYVWILFTLCTVFNMIIMLNLLIAIISESFARINSVSTQASYQEKAEIIAENDYLIPASKKRRFCEPNQYLIIATDVEAELKEKGDFIDYKLEGLTHRINTHADTIQHSLEAKFQEIQDETKKDLEKILTEVREDNQKMMEIIQELTARLPPLPEQ